MGIGAIWRGVKEGAKGAYKGAYKDAKQAVTGGGAVYNQSKSDAIVKVASDNQKTHQWDHHTVMPGERSRKYTEDADGFVAYDPKTGRPEDVICDHPSCQGQARKVWRIHDGTEVNVYRNEDGKLHMAVLKGDGVDTKDNNGNEITLDSYGFPPSIPIPEAN